MMVSKPATYIQYCNRLIEWVDSKQVIEAYQVFEDLVNNGFDYDNAFRITVHLFQES